MTAISIETIDDAEARGHDLSPTDDGSDWVCNVVTCRQSLVAGSAVSHACTDPFSRTRRRKNVP